MAQVRHEGRRRLFRIGLVCFGGRFVRRSLGRGRRVLSGWGRFTGGRLRRGRVGWRLGLRWRIGGRGRLGLVGLWGGGLSGCGRGSRCTCVARRRAGFGAACWRTTCATATFAAATPRLGRVSQHKCDQPEQAQGPNKAIHGAASLALRQFAVRGAISRLVQIKVWKQRHIEYARLKPETQGFPIQHGLVILPARKPGRSRRLGGCLGFRLDAKEGVG